MIQGYQRLQKFDEESLPRLNDMIRRLFNLAQPNAFRVFTTIPTTDDLDNGEFVLYNGGTIQRLYSKLDDVLTYIDLSGSATTTTRINDADGDTKVDVEESADEDKIRMDVAGVEVFVLQNDGILDLAKQSRIRAYRDTSVQTIQHDTITKVQFNGLAFDNQSEFDPTTNFRFTAKKAGYYLITTVLGYLTSVADKFADAMIYKNGTMHSLGRIHTSNAVNPAAAIDSAVVPLAANDYIEIWTYHYFGVSADIRNSEERTYLNIHKLS